MVRRGTYSIECRSMIDGRIAFVRMLVVLRMQLLEFGHHGITMGLGKYARSSDVPEFSIAFHDANMGNGGIWIEAITIDGQYLWNKFQRCNGSVHGEEGGAQDVDAIDLFRGRQGDGPCQ